jgi:hypothetical protein
MTSSGSRRPPGRYPRAAFDTCYWLLADLCEQTVDMPLAQAWPIQEAFDHLASIGTPRHLELLDPTTTSPPGRTGTGTGAGTGTGTGMIPATAAEASTGAESAAAHTADNPAYDQADDQADDRAGDRGDDRAQDGGVGAAEALAADLLRRVAALRGQAGSWPEARAWDEIRDLLTAAFSDHPGHPGHPGHPRHRTGWSARPAPPARPPVPVRALTGERPPPPPPPPLPPVRPGAPRPSTRRPPSAGRRGLS